jgi:hypothetical protein
MDKVIGVFAEPLSLDEVNINADAILSLLKNRDGIMHSTTNT